MEDLDIRVVDNSNIVLRELAQRVHLTLEAVGATAEGYAKEDTPVSTGRLRNSITYAVKGGQSEANTSTGQQADVEEYKKKAEPEDKAVYIGTNVKYAPQVEYMDNRTHTSGKAHFLRDAIAKHQDEYKKIIKAGLQSYTQ